MENEKTPRVKVPFSAIVAALSLIVALIALIPAFLSLNKEKADLYYSYVAKHYETPEGIDDKLFDDFLIKNDIPRHRFALQFQNGGNAPVKETKLSVKTLGPIVRYLCNPSQKDKPVWVEVPENKELGFNSGVTNIVETIRNLSPNRLVVFVTAFEGSSSNNPQIEIFGDGIEAKYISNISAVPKWNQYRVFYLPAYILLGGLAFTLIWIFGSVVLSNKEYRELIVDIVASVGDSFMSSLPFTGNLYSTLKEIRKKTEQPHSQGRS